MTLAREKSSVKRRQMMQKVETLAKHGGDRRSAKAKTSQVGITNLISDGGMTRAYTVAQSGRWKIGSWRLRKSDLGKWAIGEEDLLPRPRKDLVAFGGITKPGSSLKKFGTRFCLLLDGSYTFHDRNGSSMHERSLPAF